MTTTIILADPRHDPPLLLHLVITDPAIEVTLARGKTACLDLDISGPGPQVADPTPADRTHTAYLVELLERAAIVVEVPLLADVPVAVFGVADLALRLVDDVSRETASLEAAVELEHTRYTSASARVRASS